MHITKFIFGFLLRFVLVYGLLTALWFSGGEYYAKALTAGGNLISSFWSQPTLRFQQIQPQHPLALALAQQAGTREIEILWVKEKTEQWILIISSADGYIPTALVLALILATPITWKRKGRSVLWGMMLVHVFFVFSQIILILFFFSYHQEQLVVTFSPFWQAVLSATVNIVIGDIWTLYVVPILIWILVTFRRSDWRMVEQMLLMK